MNIHLTLNTCNLSVILANTVHANRYMDSSRTHKPQLGDDFQILIKYRRSALFVNTNTYVHICM